MITHALPRIDAWIPSLGRVGAPPRPKAALPVAGGSSPDERWAPRRLLQRLRSKTERQTELRGASLLWDGDVAGTGASGSALKREHLRLLPESLCIVQEEPRQRVSQQPPPGGIRAAAHTVKDRRFLVLAPGVYGTLLTAGI